MSFQPSALSFSILQQPKAIKHFNLALSVDPNHPDALLWLGYFYAVYAGDSNAAEPLVRRLMETDPLTPMTHHLPGVFHWMKGEFGLAITSMRKWLQMNPKNRAPKYWIAHLLGLDKQFEEAFELIDQIVEYDPKDGCASIFFRREYKWDG